MIGTEISRDALYGLDEFKARMNWGDRAMRTARREGLQVRYAAGRAYVLGEDAFLWLQSREVSENAPRGGGDQGQTLPTKRE